MCYRLKVRMFSVIFLLTFNFLNAAGMDLPQIHVHVAMQGEKYYGEDDPNIGYIVPDNKFTVRHAAIEVSHSPGRNIEYNFEAGSASCAGSGSFVLMEAGVFFRSFNFLKFGIMKGHIMRGFEFHQSCTEVLTAEKPRFTATFSPCHQTGAVMEGGYDFTGGPASIRLQIAYLNGAGGTVDAESNINLGLVFHTPLSGLSVSGFYSGIEEDLELDGEAERGYRTGIGIDLDLHNFLFRTEYYMGKGFYSEFSDINSENLEMRAFFVQGAYTVKTGLWIMPYFRPYIMYQSWDKASNAEGEHLYTYITGGLSFGLDEENTRMRIDFEKPVSAPDGVEDEASILTVRLQSGF